MRKIIERPWCIRKTIEGVPIGVGKIISESEDYLMIIHNEQQLYSPQLWSKDYVDRFHTLEKAAHQYIKSAGLILNNYFDEEEIKDEIRKNFPLYFKERLN